MNPQQQPLKRVKTKWKALGNVLNDIIDYVNRNTPKEGSGIRMEQHPDGTMISVGKPGQSDASDTGTPTVPGANFATVGGGGGGNDSTTPAGELASWQLIQVLDDSTQTIYDKWVWGGSNFNDRPCNSA